MVQESGKNRKFSLKSGKNPETMHFVNFVQSQEEILKQRKFSSLKSGRNPGKDGSTHFRERSIPTEVEFSRKKNPRLSLAGHLKKIPTRLSLKSQRKKPRLSLATVKNPEVEFSWPP